MTPSPSTGERRTEMTMTQSDLTARIDASEALTRLQKAVETGDWAELKPEEAQEAATLLVESAARIRNLEAQLAAQAEALARVEKVRDELRGDTRVHRTAAADSVQAGLWMLNTRCSAFAEVTHETACRLTTALLGAQS